MSFGNIGLRRRRLEMTPQEQPKEKSLPSLENKLSYRHQGKVPRNYTAQKRNLRNWFQGAQYASKQRTKDTNKSISGPNIGRTTSNPHYLTRPNLDPTRLG
ncbi:hypothetical protein PIB30_048664 [Stylosanthes scabra]|uniref:Uncharacterized protein n=1 Tax=Stylosanthes scabra TaxID=79078 RepID=A0ABU6YFQ6_9FABA|nr:hypothetical protein [Stylosanthes scabra]